ncbi:nidogen-like domain-containing protein [Undibacterium sp.]|uniref:nidogen-like domain-containing protein n=1 Tax=Undibacterium sp. TaxID=1914977 RepID=UPI00375048E6
MNAGTSNPIIAPFLADIDTRTNITSLATGRGNSTGADLVSYDLDTVNHIFTVTWDDVGYFDGRYIPGRTDKLNAFQLQLIDKGNGNFDIVFRYEDINWTTGRDSGGENGLGGDVARAGYSSGTSEGYYELPQSGNQARMLALDEDGLYVFNVRNGQTHTASNNDTLTGGAGNDLLIGGDGNHDIAVFSGPFADYTITLGKTITVTDKYGISRDGVDTVVSSVEFLKFSDKEVATAPYFEVGTGKGMGKTFSEKVETLAKFSQAAYWTRESDRLVGVKVYDSEHTEVAAGNDGQTIYDSLEQSELSDWNFLSLSNLGGIPKIDANITYSDTGATQILSRVQSQEVFHNGNIYYENGGVIFTSEVNANAAVQANSLKKPEQQLIHGSAGAVVAVSGNSLVISFRGTEDVEGPSSPTSDGPIPRNLYPVAKAVIRYILESKYNISAKQMDTFAGATYDRSLNDKAALDTIEFLIKMADGLGHGFDEAAGVLLGPYAYYKLATDPLAVLSTIVSVQENVAKGKIQLSNLVNDLTITKTDSYYWIQQDEFYELYKPLVEAVKQYIQTHSEVTNLYVTGHSLGAAMASWYMTDIENGGANLQNLLSTRGGGVEGIAFAAPGLVTNTAAESELRSTTLVNSGAKYTRLEVARDLVADITQVVQAGASVVPVYFAQPGLQLNLQTTATYDAYQYAVSQLHSMANYADGVALMRDSGLLNDLDWLTNRTYVSKQNADGFYDPIVLMALSYLKAVGTVATNQTSNGDFLITSVTGDAGTTKGEYANFAEKYTENDVIVGTILDDVLIGDGSGAVIQGTHDLYIGGSFKGTDDIFYIGTGGNDIVYGDQRTDDDGGLDTVVYNFSTTHIALGRIDSARVSGDYTQDRLDKISSQNTVEVTIDDIELSGQPKDTLYDIEQLHFVDSPSDKINLLAGDSGNNLIDGMGGNDYLFGAAGNDVLIGGLGNDRIHGGKGNDTAQFSGSFNNYTFVVNNFALEVTNINSNEKDVLYSVENISIGGVVGTARDIIWKGGRAFDSANGLYPDIGQKLLSLYAPVFACSGNDADNLTVYAKLVKDASNQITALRYELREKDLFSDDHWYFEVLLGDDYLPVSFASIVDVASTSLVDPTAQVRNVWDTDVTHIGNHAYVFLDVDRSGAYLTKEIVPTFWLSPSDSSVGTSYTLNFEGFLDTDFDYRSNADSNDDLWRSAHYEINGIPNGEVKLVGLPSGLMEMGFLFYGTPLAALGHFDLV